MGVYVYTVTFTDDYSNSITDMVTFSVNDEGGNFGVITLLISIGTVGSVTLVGSIIMVKKRKHRLTVE